MKNSLLFFSLLLAPLALFAQDSPDEDRPVGYSFLRTPVGARPSAMAASFVSMSNDVHAVFFNPAGIADISERSAAFGYLNHILDIQSGQAVVVLPQAQGKIGVALQYTDYGSFARTDEFGTEQGNFSANNLVASLSYAQVRAERVMLGGSLKYIRSVLEDFTSDAYALDLGIIYNSPFLDNLTFGAGIFNLGNAISAYDSTKESLPLSFQAGVSKKLAHLPLHYSLSVVKYADDDFRFRAGGEFTLSTGLFLRLGYDSVGQDQKVGTSSDRLAGISGGLGLDYRNMKFDYGLSSFGEVGSLNRLSVSLRF